MPRHPLLVAALLLAIPAAASGQATPAPDSGSATVVRTVLFYSPTCPHCHELITQRLPPLLRRFGSRLTILAVNVASAEGGEMFEAMADHFSIPEGHRGVPTLVIGSRVLIGTLDIMDALPGLVEQGLAAGGMDWPDFPRLRDALIAQGLAPASPAAPDTVANPAAPGSSGVAAPSPLVASAVTPHFEQPSLAARFLADPVGNAASVVVLVAMLAALALVAVAARGGRIRLPAAPPWVVPVLAVVGAGVAAYLAFVEMTGAHAICGPVGDCNTVQQSAYARLLGVPVGVLGLAGYAAILVAWVLGAAGRTPFRSRARLAVWAMGLVATCFSVYLTFLEPFVIGATCAWCLSSALIVTLITLAATPAATQILRPRAGRAA